jgi:DNA-directed RNA polymerase subunit E'/Rpb7
MKKSLMINRSVFISPSYIDSNIMKNVFHMLKNRYEKTCNEDDGMILSIDKILKVENMISKDSCYIIFDVTFLATVVKPEIGMVLQVKPTYLLSSKGIFSKIYDNINIFIPETNIKDFKDWKYSNESYIHKNGKVVNKESVIDITINDIKFNSTKYNCVCSLSNI